MNNIIRLKKKIKDIIKKSSVTEDPVHSKNTLEWVLRLKPDADEALKIAALGHDIERAIVQRKVRRVDYKNYDEFKHAHALNSAKILSELMNECDISKELTNAVFPMVLHHETGGDERSDILRDADSISFFDVNLPFYFARNGAEETKKRCLWGYGKLTENLRNVVVNFSYEDKKLDSLVRSFLQKLM